MDRSLYIAANSAKSTWKALSVINNNLANSNTIGFRGDKAVFKTHLMQEGELNSRAQIELEKVSTDFSQGALIETGRNLDVALAGKGFIAVTNEQGQEAYTRAGSFQVTDTGLLLTADNKMVLGNAGPITLPPAQRVVISKDGTINVLPVGQKDGTLAVIDRIKLVNPDPAKLYKGEDGLIYVKDGTANVDAKVALIPGKLESSNVNSVKSLVELMELQRFYEMQINTMQNINRSVEKMNDAMNMRS